MEKDKMTQALVADKKYQGKYVAFDPVEGKSVVAFGQSAGTVIKKARKRGVKTPAIVFVPKENVAYIY